MTRAKYQKAWFPVAPAGTIWSKWGQTSARKVISTLNEKLAGWKADGYTVQQFYLVPVKKPKKKRGRK